MESQTTYRFFAAVRSGVRKWQVVAATDAPPESCIAGARDAFDRAGVQFEHVLCPSAPRQKNVLPIPGDVRIVPYAD